MPVFIIIIINNNNPFNDKLMYLHRKTNLRIIK